VSSASTTQQSHQGLGEIEACDANDPIEAAKSAGLRYVTDTSPGIHRKRAG
jgi:hypothetical protein